MKSIIFLILITTVMQAQTIFKFSKNSNIKGWTIVDDNVMGGKSSGTFGLTSEGCGIFEGDISLENNGGFSSVRYDIQRLSVQAYSKIVIRVKGDGKDYQLRIKANNSDYYSFILPFKTSGKWQEIEISLKDMYPSFRGQNLDQPNFAGDHFEQMTFLIGNKKKEHFALLIDQIDLK